jgi:signal transduction histidine kinase
MRVFVQSLNFLQIALQRYRAKGGWPIDLFIFGFLLLLFTQACAPKPQSPPSFTNASFDLEQADRFYTKAKYFRDTIKNLDSAYHYYHNAQLLYKLLGDSIQVGRALVNMAIIMEKKDRYFQSEHLAVEALRYINHQDSANRTSLAGNYNCLGIVLHQMGRYEKSTEYYRQALVYADTEESKRIYLNNIGNNFRYQGLLDSALYYFEEVLQTETSENNKVRTLSNWAFTRWMQDPQFDPRPYFFEAFAYRSQTRVPQEEISSLQHLAKYYEKQKPDSALYFAQQWLDIARVSGLVAEERTSLGFIRGLPGFKFSADLEHRYQYLSDSIDLVREIHQNSLSFFESEQANLFNHLLRQENLLQTIRLERQRNLIWVFGSLLLLAAVIYSYWMKRSKKIALLEMQQNLQEQRLKTSKKVHDVVANGLYRLMSEVENQPQFDKDNVLDRLEMLYTKSRDISYESEAQVMDAQRIADHMVHLLQSFATHDLRVILVGNEPLWWEGLLPQQLPEIEHVLQEWMVNMRKHSEATNVLIRFEKDEYHRIITYKDNGKGLPTPFHKGNGWKNTENRITSMNGVLTFEQENGKGLKIKMRIPHHPNA